MKTTKEYYKSLPKKVALAVLKKSFENWMGDVQAREICTDCVQETPNGSCGYVTINGVKTCTWIPEIGG